MSQISKLENSLNRLGETIQKMESKFEAIDFSLKRRRQEDKENESPADRAIRHIRHDPQLASVVIAEVERAKNQQFLNFDIKEQSERTFLTPTHYPKLMELYTQQLRFYWTPMEVEFDAHGWNKLTEPEKYAVKRVLVFLGISDQLVGSNLGDNFIKVSFFLCRLTLSLILLLLVPLLGYPHYGGHTLLDNAGGHGEHPHESVPKFD